MLTNLLSAAHKLIIINTFNILFLHAVYPVILNYELNNEIYVSSRVNLLFWMLCSSIFIVIIAQSIMPPTVKTSNGMVVSNNNLIIQFNG